MPIAGAKLYTSQSETQVIAFLDKVWPKDAWHLLPDCISYDRACFLLWHLATHNIASPWVQHVRLIVDAWHYIGHRADDIVCRTCCNPAPVDGSQPDLVIEEVNVGSIKNVHSTLKLQSSSMHGLMDSRELSTGRQTIILILCSLSLLKGLGVQEGGEKARLQRVQEHCDARHAEAGDAGIDVNREMGTDLDQSRPNSGNSSDADVI